MLPDDSDSVCRDIFIGLSIDVMYENQKLKEENTTLKELLEKAYEFMKQFVIDGVNLLERFLENVGKVIGKNKNK